MMHLPGRLAASTLGDLLGALHRGHATGTLELTELPGSFDRNTAGRKHRIHLFCGLVAGVDTNVLVRPLGEILHEKGLLRVDELIALMRHLGARDGRLAGEILVQERIAARVHVESGLRAQLRARLDHVYTLHDAAVSFHTARPLSDMARKLGLLSSRDFLYGRPRARDRAEAWSSFRNAPPPSSQAQNAASNGQAERRVSPNRPWAGRSAQPADERAQSDTKTPRPEETAPRSTIRALDPIRARALRTLGLGGEADERTIKQAFRRLAVELHPDKFATASDEKRAQSSARFAEVSAAYHLLVA